MRRFLSSLAAPLLLMPSLAQAATHMYLVEGDYDRVRIIDTDGYDLLGTVDVGDAPAAIAISGTGAYVANGGDDTVSVIDVTDRQVVATVNVGDAPRDIVISGTGAFVVNGGANTVTVIDITDNQVVATVNVGTSPRHIAASGTGVYVTNNTTDNMTIIDITDNQVAATVSVGDAPLGIAISGTGAYVALNGEDVIKVIDITDNLSVKTIEASSSPDLVAMTGSSLYYSIDTAATIYVVDVETEVESGGVLNIFVRDIAISGDRAYVLGGDYIHIYDASTVDQVDSVDAANTEGELAFADFDGAAFYSDTTTLAPTLTLPDNVEVCEDLTVEYSLPETPLNGSVELEFEHYLTHDLTTLTLSNSTGATFAFDTQNIVTDANIQAISGDSTLVDSNYDVTLRYQDVFGNAAAEDVEFLSVVLCEPSSSSSSSSSSVQQGGGGGVRASTLKARQELARQANGYRWASPSADSASSPGPTGNRNGKNSFELRTCDRVMRWFRGNEKMLARVNERLLKRFGFECR